MSTTLDFSTTQYTGTSLVSHAMQGLRASLVMLVICGFLYTGVVTKLGGILFPHQSTGSLILDDGNAVGSLLVGQPFSSDQYFYGRPSAADCDPTSTGGSNLAPSNPELRERVSHLSETIQKREQISADSIPIDLLAASGAGLDPHISPAAARIQINRVAAARGLSEREIQTLIERATEAPQWGMFGQTRVNVLKLNLLLDGVKSP